MDEWLVLDFDSTLSFPVRASFYFKETFRDLGPYQELAPVFRLFSGEEYARDFSSDRSHMRDSFGKWLASPPSWDKIYKEDFPSFFEWTKMRTKDITLLSLKEVKERFALSVRCT